MGLCCCKWPVVNVKDTSTQTDVMPLLEGTEARRRSGAENMVKRQSSLESALHLVQRAVEEDRSRNYEEALSLYQHALVYFLESLNYEAESDKLKEKILSKCKQYLDRAEKLAEFLHNHNDGGKRGAKPASLNDVTRSVAKMLEAEDEPLHKSDTRGAMSRMYQSIMRRKSRNTSGVGSHAQAGSSTSLKRSYSAR